MLLRLKQMSDSKDLDSRVSGSKKNWVDNNDNEASSANESSCSLGGENISSSSEMKVTKEVLVEILLRQFVMSEVFMWTVSWTETLTPSAWISPIGNSMVLN